MRARSLLMDPARAGAIADPNRDEPNMISEEAWSAAFASSPLVAFACMFFPSRER